MASFFARGDAQSPSYFSKKNAKYDTESVKRSIENAKIRIEDAGYKTEDADQRNWFEKATNLPQKQNAFFDALELLGRGGQAILNPISKAIKGEQQNVASSFFKGLSGQEKIRGSEVAEDLGIENKFGKFALGTAIDIGTDPISYVPGGVFLKGVKGAGKIASMPVKAGYNALESVAPKIKQAREEVIQPNWERTKDGLGYMFKDDYKGMETLSGGQSPVMLDAFRKAENQRRYLKEQYTKKITDTAKITGLEAGDQVGRVMEKNLKQFEDVKGYEFPDGVRRTEQKSDLLNEANVKRGDIKNISSEIRTTQKQYDEAVTQFSKGMDQTDREINTMFRKLERETKKNLDKATRANLTEASRELTRIRSQIKNFPQAEKSLLRNYKKLIRENHEESFDIVKQIRRTAPNGIKGADRNVLPNSLKNFVRQGGKGIDEVADELGYSRADDLLQDLVKIRDLPRKLSDDVVESQAKNEMLRSGALNDLYDTKVALNESKKTIENSIKQISKSSNKGRASDLALQSIEESPRFKNLIQQREVLKTQKDAIRNESVAVRQNRLDEIKKVEDEISQLRESIKNPVSIQKEIERKFREMPKDPKITQAAQSLMKSNDEIRALAEANEIPISELEGYMTHVLAKAERETRKRAKAGNFLGTNQPNKNILKQRELMGSVEDANEQVGRTMFEPNAYYATAIGQRRLIDYIQSVSFRKQVLNDPDFARPYVKGMDLPPNGVVIDSNNYKFIKESGDMLEGVASKDIGGQYVVTKATKQKLDKYKHTMTDEGSKAFLNAFDGVQSFWKRAALFSVPYHLRNDIGAKFNNWVGGMNATDLVKYSAQADREVYNAIIKGNPSKMYDEYLQQGLGSTSQSQIEFARMGVDPEKAIEKMVKERSKDTMGKVKTRLNPLRAFETSREFGDFIDQTNRYAAYKWARESLKLDPEKAAQKAFETQFDYTKTSNFERDFMVRAVPFYRWIRNNLPFQIRRFAEDPRKYVNINKGRLNTQEVAGINEENVPDWMKEGFFFAVNSDGKGSGQMLGFNLPAGDLGRLNEPLKMGIDSLTPLLKLPLELGLNRNFFYDKPIKKFEGQEKQFKIPGTNVSFALPVKAAYALEQSTGQIGRGLSKGLTPKEEIDQDTKFRMPTLGISGVLKDFDADKANYFEAREDLKALQDLMNYIEQQTGERPRLIADIKKDQKSSFFAK